MYTVVDAHAHGTFNTLQFPHQCTLLKKPIYKFSTGNYDLTRHPIQNMVTNTKCYNKSSQGFGDKLSLPTGQVFQLLRKMFSLLILFGKLLFFIILLFCLEFKVLTFFTSIGDIYFILIFFHFILTFYSYYFCFTVKLHVAQMF